MSEEKRAVTVTFRLTQEEKNNLEYCASKLRMTQTEAVVKGRRDADRRTDNRAWLLEKGYVRSIHQAVFGGLGGSSQEAAGQQGESARDTPCTDAERNQEFKVEDMREEKG